MEAIATWSDAPRIHLTELAAIIREEVAGGAARLQDDSWLHDRATAAQLDAHEYAALAALRLRLLDTGAVLLEDTAPNRIWL